MSDGVGGVTQEERLTLRLREQLVQRLDAIADALEADPERVLGVIADHVRPHQRIFVGVIDPIDMRVETAEEVRDRVLLAAKHIPLERLGTTDDCGFSPFADDVSTARDVAFSKIAARVEGTALAAQALGV